MNLTEALAAATRTLEAAGIPDPVREANRLLGAVFPQRYLDYEEIFSEEFAEKFMAVVARRAAHEPFSHITGRRAFWNHVFTVNSDVLDPRPDTETLIEAALDVPFKRVLDVGTGSGCILISLLAEDQKAHGLGIDISPKALDVARGNGTSIGVDARCEWVVSDWFSEVSGKFDLIVSNPPYINAEAYAGLDQGVREFEPKIALTPGGDGLEPYRILASQAGDYLTADGWLMVEIGFDQGDSVREIFSAQGWETPELIHDLAGKPRVVKAQVRQK